jgi:hypothetical protein
MHPAFLQIVIDDRIEQLGRSRAGSRRRRTAPLATLDEPIALRLCRVDDQEALERLAQLEGRRLPAGSFVVADLAGTIVAALPLDGGAILADPFRPTARILALLELRAQQLRRPHGSSRIQERALRWLATRA